MSEIMRKKLIQSKYRIARRVDCNNSVILSLRIWVNRNKRKKNYKKSHDYYEKFFVINLLSTKGQVIVQIWLFRTHVGKRELRNNSNQKSVFAYRDKWSHNNV